MFEYVCTNVICGLNTYTHNNVCLIIYNNFFISMYEINKATTTTKIYFLSDIHV